MLCSIIDNGIGRAKDNLLRQQSGIKRLPKGMLITPIINIKPPRSYFKTNELLIITDEPRGMMEADCKYLKIIGNIYENKDLLNA